MKTCTKCHKELPATNEYFHADKYRKDGFVCRCKVCHNRYGKEYRTKHAKQIREYRTKHAERIRESRRKHTDTARIYRLKHNYNISLNDYDYMSIRQNNVCAICKGTNKNGKRLCVDHDHTTGKVRGLLCSRCNAGIGNFRENATVLCSANEYLEKHKCR